MRTASEYQGKQVLSLTDQIRSLQGEVKRIEKERADWDGAVRQQAETMAGLDAESFAAKVAHKALLKSLNIEKEAEEESLNNLRTSQSVETEKYAATRNERQTELVTLDLDIEKRKETNKGLVIEETNLRFSISRLTTDKVLALKDTASALEDQRRAVKKLSDTKELIVTAAKEFAAGETSRKAQVDSLQEWQDRLSRREDDLNVLVERIKPEFVKIYGEGKLNKHVWEPSRPVEHK